MKLTAGEVLFWWPVRTFAFSCAAIGLFIIFALLTLLAKIFCCKTQAD